MAQDDKVIKARATHRVTCDQNEMSFLSAEYADSERGAKAIAKYRVRQTPGLSFSVEEKDRRGFYEHSYHVYGGGE